MDQAQTIVIPALKTGESITASDIGKAVVLDAAGDVVIAGAGELAIGILIGLTGSGTGVAAAVAAFGFVANAILGGSVDEGAFLKADTNGDLVATTTNNDFYIARALEAGADNDQARVFVMAGFYGA